jgi:hypothetical protein
MLINLNVMIETLRKQFFYDLKSHYFHNRMVNDLRKSIQKITSA